MIWKIDAAFRDRPGNPAGLLCLIMDWFSRECIKWTRRRFQHTHEFALTEIGVIQALCVLEALHNIELIVVLSKAI
jgi:hypothetical protein